MASRKHKDTQEVFSKKVRELAKHTFNRQCCECEQPGVTYVDITVGNFVCTSCSGILRGLNPPHRVKSISMTTFSQQEVEFLQSHGNEVRGIVGNSASLQTCPTISNPEVPASYFSANQAAACCVKKCLLPSVLSLCPLSSCVLWFWSLRFKYWSGCSVFSVNSKAIFNRVLAQSKCF
ncbi:UNVERIFIED_CONTAM: hypothetical protein FKN15_022568 [Acipenser sinensis]